MKAIGLSVLGSTVVAALLALAAPTAHAQLETPAPSPRARVEQRVGVTDFKLEYSSPGVKGRKIWGALVPFDKVWRTGANQANQLEVSREFSFGDKKLPAGTYALYSIPGRSTWTIILNSNPKVDATDPDRSTEVARVTVKPQAMAASRERMTFIFSNTTDSSTDLDLEWEKLRVRIPLKVDTAAIVGAAIEKVTAEAWRPHFQAARYLLDTSGDLTRASAYIDKSIAIQPTWWNQWVKAQILGKQGKKAEAVAAAQEAQKLGKGNNTFESFFKDDVSKAIAGWK